MNQALQIAYLLCLGHTMGAGYQPGYEPCQKIVAVVLGQFEDRRIKEAKEAEVKFHANILAGAAEADRVCADAGQQWTTKDANCSGRVQ